MRKLVACICTAVVLAAAACDMGGNPDGSGQPGQSGDLSFDLGGLENVTKVSYAFVHEDETVTGELVPTGQTVSIHMPELIGKTWQASLEVTTTADDANIPQTFRQKAYRYEGELSFNGGALQLPSPQDETRWTAMFHTQMNVPLEQPTGAETTFPVDIYFSPNPRHTYNVEFHFTAKRMLGAVIDRRLNDIDGNGNGVEISVESVSFAVDENGQLNSPDQESINLVTRNNARTLTVTFPEYDQFPDDLVEIDSFVLLDNGGATDENMYRWTLTNGTPQGPGF